MNQLDVQQTGGFPLETDTLNFMQDTYKLLNDLGFISGNATIISGCVQTGNNISDGVVFFHGELLEFRGGAIQEAVRIFQENTEKEFEDGSTKVVYKRRWMGFGSTLSGFNINFSDFKRIKTVKELSEDVDELKKKSVPVGAIMMWAGSLLDMPAGWALCNGQNGTPDLRSRFVVGFNSADGDYDAIGKTGGAKTVTLTEAQMPSHSHTGVTDSSGNHSHSYQKSVPGRGYRTQADESPHGNYQNTMTGTSGAHSHGFTTNSKGGNQAHENRPPYYTLAFIQFKGV